MRQICCKILGFAHADAMFPILIEPEATNLLLCDGETTGIAPVAFCPFCGKRIGELEHSVAEPDTSNDTEPIRALRASDDIQTVWNVLGAPDGTTVVNDQWTLYAFKEQCGRQRVFILTCDGDCFAFALSDE